MNKTITPMVDDHRYMIFIFQGHMACGGTP
jgi:hypothetical protein